MRLKKNPEVVSALKKEVEKNIHSLTEGGKLAIVKCANSFRFGCSWGFLVKSDVNYKKELDIIAEEKPSVQLFKVSNGAIIVCDEQFLAYNVNQAVPGVLSEEEFFAISEQRANNEKINFEKWFVNLLKGKSKKGVKDRGDYFEVTVGIYSMNESNTIRVNEIDYPAFRFRLNAILDYLYSVGPESVQVNALIDGKLSVVPLSACFEKEVLKGVQNALEISPTMTGAFFTFYIKK